MAMQNQIFYNFEKINRKWMFKILYTVLECEKAGFNKIKKSLNPITSKVLSNRLKNLEDMTLLTKDVVADKPLKVEYHLTGRGRRMISAMVKSLNG